MEACLRILVVDDDDVDRMAVCRAFKAAQVDVEIEEASNRASALRKLQEQPFDCVFLDYQLPDGDGLSVLRMVRTAGIKTPIVMLTGQGDEQLAVEVLKAGASDYLSKARMSPENLSHSLQNVIRVYKAEQQAEQAMEELRASEEWTRAILENVFDGILTIREQCIIGSFNPAAQRIFGYEPSEVIGQNFMMLMSAKSKTEQEKFTTKHGHIDPAKMIVIGSREVIGRRKDGTTFPVDLAISEMVLKEKRLFIAMIRDISERNQAEERLKYLATHDRLTNLPNYMLFIDLLDHVLSRARWHKKLVAVLYIDLDGFKRINDTYGHKVGDLLLEEVAGRLAICVRDGDTVARLGGDEFAITLVDVANAQDVPKVAQKILDSFSQQSVVVDGRKLFITLSIGISLYPHDGEDHDTLLKNADMAMYRVKKEGRNNYQFYLHEMNAKVSARIALETNLSFALEREEFLLFYQPQVDLKTGQIIGMEALLRWKHPDLGMVPPAQFIPLAEETGLISPIGEWVLRTACAQNRTWRDDGFRPMRVAVNLSIRQLQNQNLAESITLILKETGLDPNGLELELTESILMQNVETTIKALYKLHDMGIRLSIDDFGTGYSSLSYLKRFPIDTLKIDQVFVRDITTNPDDAAIVSMIIVLSHNLRLKVIAEGVETPEQLAFIRSVKCDEMQGYLFSRPLPAKDATKLLAEKKCL